MLWAAGLGVALAASGAPAGYAWVLWEGREHYSVTDAQVESAWAVLGTYESLEECRLDQVKLLSGETAWILNREPQPGLDADGSYVPQHRGRLLVWTVRQRPMCLPDTIDPRPPGK